MCNAVRCPRCPGSYVDRVCGALEVRIEEGVWARRSSGTRMPLKGWGGTCSGMGEKVEQAHVAAQWAETAKKLNEAADGIENRVKGFDHSKLSMTAGRLLNRRPARWFGA